VIGFVGLIVPHVMRLIVGPDHRRLFPASVLGGAILVVGADLLARLLLAPAELPIGVITSLLGCPFFLYLLRRRRESLAH
jgi:iron complex transport system permease protein